MVYSVALYNSDTTHWYSYEPSKKFFELYGLCVDHCLIKTGKKQCTTNEFLEKLSNDSIDGIILRDGYRFTLDHKFSQYVWGNMTYLECIGSTDPKYDHINQLIKYLKLGKSLTSITLMYIRENELTPEFWEYLATLNLKYLELVNCQLTYLTMEIRKMLKENCNVFHIQN